jgi:hypothetical protein
MIKTILVPTSGSNTDDVVFGTALAAARLFQAHLDFCHVRVDAGEAIRHVPHAGFARGAGLRDALDSLGAEGRARSVTAAQHVQEFCLREQVMLADTPLGVDAVSASWCEHSGPAEEHLAPCPPTGIWWSRAVPPDRTDCRPTRCGFCCFKADGRSWSRRRAPGRA